jgi:hypothetical protein
MLPVYTGGCAVVEIILGAILIIITAVLAEEAPPKWRKLVWGLFVALVIAQAVIQIRGRETAKAEQQAAELQAQKLQAKVQEANDKLDASRIEQARMAGHLEGIQTIMDNFSKSGVPGMKEFAQAVSAMAKQSPNPPLKPSLDVLCQNLTDCPSPELSKRANELAAELESLVTDYQTEFNKWVARCNAIGFGKPNFQDCQDKMGITLKGETALIMGTYRDRYQTDVTAIRIVLMNRLLKHEKTLDFDYDLAASKHGDAANLESIATDLKKMAAEVLALRTNGQSH